MREQRRVEESEKMYPLLRRIERHLRSSGTPPTRFGRDALRDPRFVFDLRNGRQPGPSTIRRVAAYLDREEQSQ